MAGLRRRARALRRTPRQTVAAVAVDVDRAARRIGGHASGLGGPLHTVPAAVRASGGRAETVIVGVPRAAWGVAQRGARRHRIGVEDQRLRIGPGVRTGPVTHRGVRRRRAWSRVLAVAQLDASRRWARDVARAVR